MLILDLIRSELHNDFAKDNISVERMQSIHSQLLAVDKIYPKCQLLITNGKVAEKELLDDVQGI